MTILESLRERKAIIDSERIKEENAGIYDLIDTYDLALENALLKLGNRSTQIKDLKHRGIYDGLALALKIVKHYGEAWQDAQTSIESHLANLNK